MRRRANCENTRNDSAIATLNAGVYGLHMARFAEPVLRLALFFWHIRLCHDRFRIIALEPETADAEKIGSFSLWILSGESSEYHHDNWFTYCHAGLSLCKPFSSHSCRHNKL